jgi:hypothetical protein
MLAALQSIPRRLALIGASFAPAVTGQRNAAASGGPDNSRAVRTTVNVPQAALVEEPPAAIEVRIE